MDTARPTVTLEWQGEAQSVIFTGSFDSWSSSLPLTRSNGGNWTATRQSEFGEKVVYKFVVDGQWRTSSTAPIEWDASGNENNVCQVPILHLPSIEERHVNELDEQAKQVEEWRTVRLARWTGEKLELVAALQPSSSLTYRLLRSAVLPTLANIEGPYRFATLSGSGTPLEELEEGREGEAEVEEGTYVLVGAATQPAPSSLPSPPSPPLPAAVLPLPAAQPTALRVFSSLPRSATRYFDALGDDSWSSSASSSSAFELELDLDLAEADERSESEFSYAHSYAGSVAPEESRSRRPSFLDQSYEAEVGGEEDDDGRSDLTFNTALSESGWAGGSVSSSAAGAEGDEEGEGGGWSTSALGGTTSEEEEAQKPLDERKSDEVGPNADAPRPFDVFGAAVKEQEVDEAWEKGWFVLVRETASSTYRPLALHPSALPLLSSIRPSAALLSISNLDPSTVKDKEDVDAQQLPTPPASPPSMLVDLPSLAFDGSSSAGPVGLELVEAVEEQLRCAVGRWVTVESADGE
ncbi:hypothetical protein JCM8097_001462 [Rhodosporidiobolus ruineniae]